MTEECATGEYPSYVETTTQMDDAHTTGRDALASSQSRGIEFYFEYAVVFIGVVGTAANALILYAMVASKQHKTDWLRFLHPIRHKIGHFGGFVSNQFLDRY